ncbi:MAG: hypothetical protein QM756_47300 [Polyangiaceae bacterium]
MVVVTALDDAPIASARRLLVTAVGNAVNSEMTLSPSRNSLANVGHAPVLVEPIVGTVTLTKLTGPLNATAYALGASGEHLAEVPLVRTPDGLALALSAASKTLHYEIVRK